MYDVDGRYFKAGVADGVPFYAQRKPRSSGQYVLVSDWVPTFIGLVG